MASNTKSRYALAASCIAAAIAVASAFTSNANTAFVQPGTSNTIANSNLKTPQAFNVAAHKSPLFMSAVEETVAGTDALEDYVNSHGGDRVIRKILIANNGMAATKSILSMRQWAYMELGDERAIQFVAMATPEDIKANAEYIRLADSFVEVPGGKNLNNYANVEVISKIANEQKVDAVWPGWGHASENPNLPATLNLTGIKFIGPPGPVMSVLGDKIAANILAQTAKVPSIPWSGSYGGPDDGPLQAELNAEGTIPDDIFEKATCRTVDEAIEAANKIGYENGIMIKASEGGGGKGIRFVDNEGDLADAYIQVQNEVIGSPIFLMQLCKNARHLEVQIVGDEHGNAVALNGRDCSTQRRFQKIFEEGPPVIAPPDTFREMERAAQRLTQNIGYVGAGTVEYLFNADTGAYFFLELNPRLQVEHPVTEGITDVNMPATQLQIAMGIPLCNMPQIRRLYGKEDVNVNEPIDFLVEEYVPIKTHVIAARITAENPDEGFKPTSGSIERIKFQSTTSVWGYFSVGSNGGIHEFADSQFGHLFAKGATREEARKSLVLALKEIEVRGEIRTTVEYLVQLLETKEFKENTIDTAWLDGIIKEKSVYVEQPPHLTVASAAILKAYEHVQDIAEEVKESFRKGQVSTGGIAGINSFDLEIAYQDTKYPFHIELLSEFVYRLTLNGESFDVELTITADEGVLVANFGGETHRIFGMDEPLGLRLSVDGVTILMPSIFDPSELRTDVTGKIVRYLQDSGADVEVGQPFIEVEAMKMIMPIKATESGKITHSLSAGSVINAGDLLASLALKDPSKVKKILPFEGDFDIEKSDYEFGEKDAVFNILKGYTADPDATIAAAFQGTTDIESASNLAVEAIEEFVRVEAMFDGKLKDDVVRQMTKDNADTLDTVIAVNLAHQKLKQRNALMLALVRQIDTFTNRFGQGSLSDSISESLEKLTKFEDKKSYGEVSLAAENIIRSSKIPGFDLRIDELRRQLQDEDVDLDKLSKSATLSAGVDLLTYLFKDDDANVRALALEVYIRRVYRAHRILDLSVTDVDGHLECKWSFRFADIPESKSIVRHGLLRVVSSSNDVVTDLPGALASLGTDLPKVDYDGPANVLHLVSVDGNDSSIEAIESAIVGQSAELNMLGVRTVNLCVPIAKKDPLYYSFPQCEGYKEAPLRRNMRPTFHHLLELSRLDDNFNLERLPSVQKNSQVYLGTEKSARAARGGPPQVVHVRGISHAAGLVSKSGSRRALIQGLDELERAQANGKVNPQASSRIFLHSLPEIEDMNAEEVATKFTAIMESLKSRLATRLLKLRVDEIEVKVRVMSTDDEGNPIIEPVRLVASSMEGEWLKTGAYSEKPDPLTGVTKEFCSIGDKENEVCFLDPYATSNIIQTKRSIARRVGSTYAYDFLGLLEVGIIGQWEEYLTSLDDASMSMPSGVFTSKELIEDEDGNLVAGVRPIGTNKVGMVSWVTTMRTPEYPEGREVVFIANDVTVQSGSFGVDEDDHYMKASVYARENKLPRVYIACNAGARIGLVDELKPKFQIKFIDEASPSKGFEYLYLKDEDYEALPEGTVNAHKVDGGWAIDDIIGTNHGIGVENLRGSGMIAGETSRAYDEIFTLSYVTGRSVGIGAYLVRLGQRIIQMKQGPMILTGYSALNKLLGKEVYNSQDQLGGPQIMSPNGVSHEIVNDDQEGVASIIQWLSFVPEKVGAVPASRLCSDPVTRDVEFRPTPTPYDPRQMLAGDGEQKGFFDDGSYKEYLADWGKSVVVGRGRLGGIPMGSIAVETRLVEQVIPADPADPNSREAILPQAGQVLFPDSSYKTAQSIRDFGKEGLPLMIFANWRGFSGGSRDMAGEILKFGAMIVDALREYEHPVYIYLPPHGELRGGSWVVVDPTINEEKMSMYADPDSRGGILEPAGIIEVKFRPADQSKVMHRIDGELQLLDSELEGVDGVDSDASVSIKEQIAARENELKGVYTQVATEFADLHDKTGRMKAKGVIKQAVPWNRSREFFYNLAQRRINEDDFFASIKAADSSIDTAGAIAILQDLVTGDYDDDKAVIEYFSANKATLDAKVSEVKKAAVAAQIEALQEELGQL
eukprot:CAMPEP_0194110112 /NCGR_PEP_ID=MMETSP0150-20130528/9428_1 /TAXON_ID=122233 /ORGANISM="Chaetoceros debilis, Strain MM31A-1" /LENGTH=2089 /DNA_ID=CAMNT_0038799207 /DNA_START=48 /DNA_END=6317 /DNA_ORIENTATION=+